jgi:hypothetical protein
VSQQVHGREQGREAEGGRKKEGKEKGERENEK